MSDVTLNWDHPVDLSTGLEPTAFGVKLFADEDGNYTGTMFAERAKVELTRKGRAFTKAKAKAKAKAVASTKEG